MMNGNLQLTSRWKYLLGVIAVVVAVSIGVTWFVVINRKIDPPVEPTKGRPLTQETLSVAQELWATNGPASYDLRVTSRLNGEEPKFHTLQIRNRELKDVKIIKCGNERYMGTMEFWFTIIQNATRQNAEVTAEFDERTGAVRRFVRNMRETNTTQEMTFSLEAVNP